MTPTFASTAASTAFLRLTLIVALTLFAAASAVPRAWSGQEEVPAADASAVRAVIESQLGAFRADDGALAFSHASPILRQKFGSAENFMSMVRTRYEAVYRPHMVEFLDARRYDGITAQAVHFIGPDGRGIIGIYMMEQQEDGSWLINGVQMVPASDVAS